MDAPPARERWSVSIPKLSKAQKVKRAERLIGRSIGDGRIYLHKVIGHGSFGVVMHAYGPRDERTGRFREYAVKCMSKLMSIKEHILAADEFRIHRNISGHPNILPFLEILQDDLWFYLVLDYCPGGDLFKQIVHRRRYFGNDRLIKQVYCQLLDAVEYCHSRNVYHRDLKPENCLVKDDGETVLLMDFGLATEKRWCYEWGCGSRFYMAPEVYGSNKEPYRADVADVWALGVILVNLVTGRNPWRKAQAGDDVYDSFCRDPAALQQILPISDDLNDLLRRIFVEPKLRLTIKDIRAEVSRIDTFLALDSPALQSWQDTLDRDRNALLGIKEDKPAPVLDVHIPGEERDAGVQTGTPNENQGHFAQRNVRDAAARGQAPRASSPETPPKILNWRQEVYDNQDEFDDDVCYEQPAPSWSSGPSPPASAARRRALRRSTSTDSQAFPVTPQMATGYAAAPGIAGTLSPSQMNRRGSIRRKLFARPSRGFADDADESGEEFPGITMENMDDDERESRHGPHKTLGQKMKNLVHRSVRALNSRAPPEMLDD